MDEEAKRPNAALINREWYESAKSVLSADGLGKVIVAACNYVIYRELEPKLSGVEAVVFAMIRPALDSDISKYLERCARNAANAKSKRVAASGSEWERVGATTTTTTTPTTTTNTTTTTTTSLSPEEQEKRERWIVFGYFWSIGSNAIQQECSAFWSYYESLGWKNNKGAAIVNKLACARMWKRQFDCKTPPNGADAWFKVMQECQIADYNVFAAFLGAERKDDEVIVRLRCTESWLADFRAKCGHLLGALSRLWRVQTVTLERIP